MYIRKLKWTIELFGNAPRKREKFRSHGSRFCYFTGATSVCVCVCVRHQTGHWFKRNTHTFRCISQHGISKIKKTNRIK